MLLAVLSDVHANLPALEAVLSDARLHKPDGYVTAGDLSGGPHPTQTLQALRSLRGWIIRGNGEGYLTSLWRGDAPVEWRTQRQFGFMRWCANQVRDDDRAFISGLPEELKVAVPHGPAIRVVHGSPGRPALGIYPRQGEREVVDALDRMDEPVLVCGHTHEQWQVEINGRLVLNPGAICGPCDGTIGAQYALLRRTNGRWQAELRQVDYNIAEVRRAFDASGLLEEGGPFARAVLAGIETGIDVPRALLRHANHFRDAQGLGRERFISDEIWDAAAACFNWERYERGVQ